MWVSVLSAALGIYASSQAREPFRALIGGLLLMVLTLVPATSSAALQMRGLGLKGFFFPDSPGAVCTWPFWRPLWRSWRSRS
jgi:hypothetical protein